MSLMTRKELEAFRLDIASQIEDSVVVDTPVDSKWKASVMFLLEGILTELEYTNDATEPLYEKLRIEVKGKAAGYYKESKGGFTVKVGGTD